MTEAEWLACTDPIMMLKWLGNDAGERKLLCFAHEWTTKYDSAFNPGILLEEPWLYAWGTAWEDLDNPRRQQEKSSMIRDIFGNPFRPVAPDSVCHSSAVKQLADTIYADRAFERLPILADALEEAGCTDAEILAHCRQTAEHWRGCWVVDLILGKE